MTSHVCEYSCLERPEEGVEPHEAGVQVVSCKLPKMGAGSQTWVLYKSVTQYRSQGIILAHDLLSMENVAV